MNLNVFEIVQNQRYRSFWHNPLVCRFSRSGICIDISVSIFARDARFSTCNFGIKSSDTSGLAWNHRCHDESTASRDRAWAIVARGGKKRVVVCQSAEEISWSDERRLRGVSERRYNTENDALRPRAYFKSDFSGLGDFVDYDLHNARDKCSARPNANNASSVVPWSSRLDATETSIILFHSEYLCRSRYARGFMLCSLQIRNG